MPIYISSLLQKNPNENILCVRRATLLKAKINASVPSARYIDVKDPIGSKLLFLSPICSREGAYSLKTFSAETVMSKGKQNL